MAVEDRAFIGRFVGHTDTNPMENSSNSLFDDIV